MTWRTFSFSPCRQSFRLVHSFYSFTCNSLFVASTTRFTTFSVVKVLAFEWVKLPSRLFPDGLLRRLRHPHHGLGQAVWESPTSRRLKPSNQTSWPLFSPRNLCSNCRFGSATCRDWSRLREPTMLWSSLIINMKKAGDFEKTQPMSQHLKVKPIKDKTGQSSILNPMANLESTI